MTEHEQFFHALTDGTHHLQLEARAGTGKTYGILEGAKLLPGKDQHIMAFNTTIAKEINDKLTKQKVKATCQTAHSTGFGIIREHLGRYIQPDDGPKLYGEVKDMVLKEDISPVIAVISHLKNQLVMPDKVDEDLVLNVASRLGKSFEDSYVAANAVQEMLERALDFRNRAWISLDDMIYVPAALGLVSARQPDVLYVDEAQDLNPAQHAMLMRCFPGARTVVVGDPYQAIYQWRGAHQHSMQELARHYSAVILPLTVTRRCPLAVVDVARRLVPDFKPMPDAAQGLVRNGSLEWRPSALAVSRCNAPLFANCLRMISDGHPAHVEGRDFQKTIQTFIKRVIAFGRVKVLRDIPQAMDNLMAAEERKAKQRFAEPEQIQAYLDPLTDQIECLRAIAGSVDTLDELEPRVRDLFSRTDGMKFSTVHKAKGLEADTVFIIDPDRMPLPPRGSDGEGSGGYSEGERNVAYVAFTRAANELVYCGKTPAIVGGA